MYKRLSLGLIAAISLSPAVHAQQVVELESLDTLMQRSTGAQPSDRPSAQGTTVPQGPSSAQRSADRRNERDARRAARDAEQASEDQRRETEKLVRRQAEGQERFARSLQLPNKPQKAPKRVRTLPPTANRY